MSILIILVLVLSWMVPNHFPPWTAFHSEVPGFIAAALALMACWRWNKNVVQLPVAVGGAVVLVFVAAMQLTGGLISYGSDVLLVAIYLGTFAAAWMWGYHWTNRTDLDQLQVTICIFFVAVGLVTAWQVLVQWFGVELAFQGWVLDGLPGDARPRANLGQPNQSATTLLTATAAIAILRVKRRIGNTTLWTAAFTLGFALVLTRSRTSLVSALLLVGVYIWVAHKNKNIALKPVVVIIWIILLFGSSWALPSINGISSTIGSDHYQMVAVGTRPLIWKQLIVALMEKPWLGYGWLQVPSAQQSGALHFPGIEQTNYSHNILIDLLIYMGIPCAVLLLGVCTVWLWKRIQRIPNSHTALVVLVLLIPFGVHSLLEFPHAYAYFLVAAGLLLGVFDRTTESATAPTIAIGRRFFLAAVIMWSMLLLATGYEYMQVEEDFRINRFENRRLGTTPPEYSPPRIVLLTQLREVLQAMRLRATPHMSTGDVDMLVRVSKRYSWAQMHFRTALALGLNNRPIEATQQLRVIKALFAEDIYAEAKENYLRLQTEKYPELAKVAIP